jgi:hypothetical protein
MQTFKSFEKLLIAILVIGSLLSNPSVRLLDKFICQNNEKSIGIDLSPYDMEVSWRVGMWIKIVMAAGINLPFMAYNCSLDPIKPFIIQTKDTQNFNLVVDGIVNFSFTGATDPNESNSSVIVANPANAWHYFGFGFQDRGSYLQLSRSIDYVTPAYRQVILNRHTPQNTKLVIGETGVGSSCLFDFRIYNVDLISSILSFTGFIVSLESNELTSLYKLNFSLLSKKLYDIIDPRKPTITVISAQNSKSALNNPRRSDVDRIGFGKSAVQLTYDLSMVPRIPPERSSVLFISFQVSGTKYSLNDYYRSTNWTVKRLDFTIYARTHNLPGAVRFHYLENTTGFTGDSIINSSFVYNAIGNLLPIIEEIIPYPQSLVDFQITAVNYIFITTQQTILDLTPSCFARFTKSNDPTNINFAFPIGVTLYEDDIITTNFQYLLDLNYINVQFGEISFGSFGTFNSEWRWRKSENEYATYLPANYLDLDLKRFVDNSYHTIDLNLNVGLTDGNCDENLPNCAYCDYSKCLLCKYRFAMTPVGCVACPMTDLYDYISQRCDGDQYSLINNLEAFIPQLNELATKKVVNINIIFRVLTDLSNPVSNPVHYIVDFNSLESTSYNPMYKTEYTLMEKAAELSHLITLFSDILLRIEKYAPYTMEKMIYNFVEPMSYVIFSPYYQFEKNICYSPMLRFKPTSPSSGVCEQFCLPGFLYEPSTSKCISCISGCSLCLDLVSCLFCNPNCSFFIGQCICTNKSGSGNTKIQMSNFSSESIQALFLSNPILYLILSMLQAIKEKAQVTNSANCKIYYYQTENGCKRCDTGCTSCLEKKCLQCDSNHILNESGICVSLGNLLILLAKTLAQLTNCSNCFQTYDYLSRGCQTCKSECPCSLKALLSSGTFILTCQNATLDADYFSPKPSFEKFSMKRDSGDFAIRLFLKSNVLSYSYSIDSMMIKNTTQCFIDMSKEYALTFQDDFWLNWQSYFSESFKTVAAVCLDVAIVGLALFSWPLANLIVSLTQFNKVFLYLSMWNIKVGGLFEFINFTFYQARKPQTQWFIGNNNYSYLTTYAKYQGDKLISDSSVYVYLLIVGVSKIAFWIASFTSRRKNGEEYKKFTTPVIRNSQKVAHFITLKYFFVLILSIPLLIANCRAIDSVFYKILFGCIATLMLYFPISVRVQAYCFVKNTDKKDNSYLASSLSNTNLDMSRCIAQNTMLDEAMIVIRCLALYHLRDFKEAMLIAAIATSVFEIFSIFKWYNTFSNTITAFKLMGCLSMLVFTSLLLCICFNIQTNSTLLNSVYVLSNIGKLGEGIGLKVLTFLKNRANRISVTPIKKKNLKLIIA